MIAKSILGSLLFLVCTASHAVEVKRIDLFVQHGTEIKNQTFARDIEYQVHYVDEIKALESKVGNLLSSDPDKARLELKNMIKDARFGESFGRAYRPSLLAQKYGITGVPAALINRKGIVYGSSDIAEIKTYVENMR